MFKLIFTLVTLTTPPGAAPSATSSTDSVDFADGATCGRVLDSLKTRGDHVMTLEGSRITLHFVGGKCVPDGPSEAQAANRRAQPDFDPFGLLPR